MKKLIKDFFHIKVLSIGAYQKLIHLKQLPGQLVSSYTQQFILLVNNTNCPEIIAIQLYKEGLDYYIYYQLQMWESPLAKDVYVWEDEAQKLGKRFETMKVEYGDTRTNSLFNALFCFTAVSI